MKFFLTLVFCVLVFFGCQADSVESPTPTPPVPVDTGGPALTLATRDFSDELPDEIKETKTVVKTTEIAVKERAQFEVLVHYHQVVGSPGYFRKIEVELPKPVPVVQVGAEIGFPINLGTQDEVDMAVPIIVTWSGARWTRASQWTLRTDGSVEAMEPATPTN